jgi:DNA-binding PadR family transcriptional regulator
MSETGDEQLPTTSYAVLGMLAIRPWTGYELTQQMRRSLDYCWPKADSVLYEEPRRLVAAGLARATAEEHAGRQRTRYHITAKGRRTLKAWLAAPPGDPRLEVEPLLRLLFAEHGTADDLRQAIASFRSWAESRYEAGIAMFRDYLETGGPFPDRLHLQVLFGAFYEELFFLVRRWTTMVDEELDSWPSTAGVGWTPGVRALAEQAVSRHQPPANR